MQIERRTFLKHTAAGAMLSCFPASLTAIERAAAGPLERRALGRTGEKLSIIGFGGIVVRDATAAQAAERVAHAIDRGVNYFDVAPSYGNAEEMLGPALEPYRKNAFLACKTLERSRDGAAAELEASLRHLRTDHVDLYQLHAVTKKEDVAQILGPSGALEAFVAARAAGKTRFLGFSAHNVDAALALIEAFSFDTILFPINFATWHAGNFGPQVLAAAQKKGMGILALKSMAYRPWRWRDEDELEDLVRAPRGSRRSAPGIALHPLSSRHGRHPARRRHAVRAGTGSRRHVHAALAGRSRGHQAEGSRDHAAVQEYLCLIVPQQRKPFGEGVSMRDFGSSTLRWRLIALVATALVSGSV
jgi:aryl-alcohol dehydrogenase-like predicted oxidoreductase